MQEEFDEIKAEASEPSCGKKRIICLVVAFIAVALISVMLTFSLTVNYFFSEENGEYAKFEVLKKYIDKYSYYEPDHDAMMDAALKAYVSGTGDRYAEYYNAEDFKALAEDNEGRFVGIGVTISETETVYHNKSVTLIEVIGVYESSPANEAGIREGDMIYSVYTDDGEIFTDDVGMDVVTSKIKGEEGTEVKISVLRGSENEYEKLDFTMKRRKVDVNSVTYEISESQPTVGIVRVTRFDLRTPLLFKGAFNDLKRQGITKVVLDMRGNPGGDLSSVIACASYFLVEGDVIISTEDNDGNKLFEEARSRTYGATYSSCNVAKDEIGMFRDFEVSVLVNRATASAAELLTAVFRDYELAVTVGEKTYGKGTMQTIYPLDRAGFDGGVKMTTNVYFPPCGESYDGMGIIPDITLDNSATEDLQLTAAIEKLVK